MLGSFPTTGSYRKPGRGQRVSTTEAIPIEPLFTALGNTDSIPNRILFGPQEPNASLNGGQEALQQGEIQMLCAIPRKSSTITPMNRPY